MWSRSPTGIIKTRGVIVRDNKIFLCKFSGGADFFGLPGGTLDLGESLKTGLEREIFEELGIHAKVGPLVHTQEVIREHESMFDFWYWIDNAEDFVNIDLSKASHGFEHEEVGFYSLDDLRIAGETYKPASMDRLLSIWVEKGPVFVEQN